MGRNQSPVYQQEEVRDGVQKSTFPPFQCIRPIFVCCDDLRTKTQTAEPVRYKQQRCKASPRVESEKGRRKKVSKNKTYRYRLALPRGFGERKRRFYNQSTTTTVVGTKQHNTPAAACGAPDTRVQNPKAMCKSDSRSSSIARPKDF
jgi:hypothetical protein